MEVASKETTTTKMQGHRREISGDVTPSKEWKGNGGNGREEPNDVEKLQNQELDFEEA